MKIDRIPYLVDMGVGLLFAAITVALNLDQGYQPWRQVCDALFVAATVLLGVGGLQFFRNHGAFDTMGYGMKQLANTIAPWAISPDSNLGKKESFLEYKERKEENRRSPKEMVLAGLTYLILSLLALLVYYAVS